MNEDALDIDLPEILSRFFDVFLNQEWVVENPTLAADYIVTLLEYVQDNR